MKREPLLEPSDFQSVYVGERGQCCCGCAGDYVYPERLRDHGLLLRGYELLDSEVSDHRFVVRLGRLERLLRAGKIDMVTPGFISAVDGKALITAHYSRVWVSADGKAEVSSRMEVQL